MSASQIYWDEMDEFGPDRGLRISLADCEARAARDLRRPVRIGAPPPPRGTHTFIISPRPMSKRRRRRLRGRSK